LFTGLTAGAYDVVVKDVSVAVSCIVPIDNPVVITEPLAPLTVSGSVTDVTCNSGSNGIIELSVSGGTPNSSGDYNYVWKNSSDDVIGVEPAVDPSERHSLIADTYTITVSDDNGCIEIVNYVVNEPAPLTLNEVDASHIDVDCNGEATGQFEVVAGGGSGSYEYSIDGGTNWDSGPTFSNLAAGIYNVWVRDAADENCVYTGMASVEIKEPEALSLSVSSVTNVSCFGEADGEVVLTAGGGSGNYVYSKDGGASWQASNVFDNLSPDSDNLDSDPIHLISSQ
jgi:hypothetical protein